MRRLIAFRRAGRPGRPGQKHDERGAVVVISVAFMLVVLAIAALVVDIGAIHDERRQLQNGADAAALAIAHTCAMSACPTVAAAKLFAAGLADGNTIDGAATIESVSYSGKNVTVQTKTRASDGGTILPYAFAQSFAGKSGDTVFATATATWSPIAAAPALPLAVSMCDLANFRMSTGDTVMLFAKNPGCEGSKDSPGAFGWLGTGCPADNPAPIKIGSGVPTSTGKSSPKKGCLDSAKGMDVLVPVFSAVTGTGNNTTYTIVGFAALHLTGFHFPGEGWPSPPPCNGQQSCIEGRFIDFVTAGSPGTGTNFGASTVRLVS